MWGWTVTVDLKQAVERLEEQAAHHESTSSHYRLVPGGELMAGIYERKAAAIRLVLSALSRAEAERDLLAEECMASRELAYSTLNPAELWNMRLAALNSARAATDAAGVLEPRSGDIVVGEGK